MARVLTSKTIAAVLLLTPASAFAQEVFGGVLVHDVDTPTSLSGIERGLDVQVGYRGGRIGALAFIGSPSPYVFGSVSTAGATNFAAAGLSWKFGRQIYLRPGIGLAVHDGPGRVVPGDGRIDFGSRILFEPEIAVGAELSPRVSVEASWVHLSHGTLFSGQNPGLDSIGARVNYRF